MKPTISSIAKLCGVSRGTVDRVLNDRDYVAPEVKMRVLRAVEKTGYVHHRKTGTDTVPIGFLMTKWEDEYFIRQTERGIARAQQVLSGSRLALQVEKMDSRSDEEYIRRMYELADAGVRGIIINAADNIILSAAINDLAERGIPTVTYNSDLPESRRVCHVGQDLEKSGEVAAGLLARAIDARDKILVVTGNMEFLSNKNRIDSFCRHAAELGIGSDRIIIAECFEKYDLTYETIVRYLNEDSRIRAIYMGTESVPACMDAVRKVHRKNQIHVVANDLTRAAKKGLQNGSLDFVVEQDFSAQAYEAILVMYALAVHGRKPQRPVRYVSTGIYVKELL